VGVYLTSVTTKGGGKTNPDGCKPVSKITLGEEGEEPEGKKNNPRSKENGRSGNCDGTCSPNRQGR